MNKLCTMILLLMAVYAHTTGAYAAAREYDFEIIIFEDTSGKYRDAEQWPEWSPGNPPGDTRADAGAPASIRNIPDGLSGKQDYPQANSVINITPIESIGLDRYAEALRRSSRYHVLVHMSWRQAGLDDNASVSIPIDSRTDNAKQENTTGIHGDIKLVLGRYLHIYTDLVYQQPRTQPPPVWQTLNTSPYKSYPIKYHRKMRSKELHYIDHPLVGILVMALPVKVVEETSTDHAAKASQ